LPIFALGSLKTVLILERYEKEKIKKTNEFTRPEQSEMVPDTKYACLWIA
jgi:hypothetical protein